MSFIVTYGEGEFIEGQKRIRGRILMDECKLFLQEQGEDIAATFIPVDKIERVKKNRNFLTLEVHLSIFYRYVVNLKGEGEAIKELLGELIRRLHLRKKFLRQEWYKIEK